MTGNPKRPAIYHLTGTLLGCRITETYNSLLGANVRLDELAAAANDIAEGDPVVRSTHCPIFALTDALLPELMNVFTGETLVRIEEQLCAKTRGDGSAATGGNL